MSGLKVQQALLEAGGLWGEGPRQIFQVLLSCKNSPSFLSKLVIMNKTRLPRSRNTGEINFSLMFALGRFKSRKCLGLCGRGLKVSLAG